MCRCGHCLAHLPCPERESVAPDGSGSLAGLCFQSRHLVRLRNLGPDRQPRDSGLPGCHGPDSRQQPSGRHAPGDSRHPDQATGAVRPGPRSSGGLVPDSRSSLGSGGHSRSDAGVALDGSLHGTLTHGLADPVHPHARQRWQLRRQHDQRLQPLDRHQSPAWHDHVGSRIFRLPTSGRVARRPPGWVHPRHPWTHPGDGCDRLGGLLVVAPPRRGLGSGVARRRLHRARRFPARHPDA